jgi:DNA-binding CsgD family transcriptional regulator/N-acetylneuraminic acid mutarotase
MPTVKSNELSERELDILRLVATGASNKEIAQKLFISLNTVKVHLRNIFGKIGVTSRTEAAMYAVRIGLVETVSTKILSQEESLQDKDNPDFQGDNSSGLSQTALLPTTGSFVKRYSKYIGLFGGLLLLLIVIGSVYALRNIIRTYPTAAATPTPRVQWLQLSGLPTPRWGLAVTAYENQIYAIGGENKGGVSNIIDKYDPQTNAWTDLTLKPTSVTDVKAAVIGGFIYVPGGKLASGLPTDVNEIYDPVTNQWSSGRSLPKPLSAYAMAVFEGRMYLFGGWDGEQVVNEAFVYDYRNDSWSEIPSMPTARSYAGAVVVGGNIYIIGGWDGNRALTVNEVFRPDYSGTDSQWKQAPALPSGRYGMGTTNLADIIFVIGGIGLEDNLTTIALSPGDHNWGQLESPIPNGWSFLSAATVGTRLYVLGGKTEAGASNQMWSYQAIFTIIFPIIR